MSSQDLAWKSSLCYVAYVVEGRQLPGYVFYETETEQKGYFTLLHNIGSFSLINGLMLIFLFQQEWFYRLAQQCCFAGHPKNQKTKASMPHEAIQMLSVLNLKEVSDIVNHKVSFLL